MALDRRPKLLVDALGAVDAVLVFAAGRALEAYEADLMLRSAVERQNDLTPPRAELRAWLGEITG